jgi:hypothetical protein
MLDFFKIRSSLKNNHSKINIILKNKNIFDSDRMKIANGPLLMGAGKA